LRPSPGLRERLDGRRFGLRAGGLGFLEDHHVLVFEEIETVAQRPVAPEVGPPALAALVALDIFDVDGLQPQTGLPADLHAGEAQRNPLALGVEVADDQGQEAAGLEESGGRGHRLPEAVQEGLQRGGVGEVTRVGAEADDIVIGWVEDQTVSPGDAEVGQGGLEDGQRLRGARV